MVYLTVRSKPEQTTREEVNKGNEEEHNETICGSVCASDWQECDCTYLAPLPSFWQIIQLPLDWLLEIRVPLTTWTSSQVQRHRAPQSRLLPSWVSRESGVSLWDPVREKGCGLLILRQEEERQRRQRCWWDSEWWTIISHTTDDKERGFREVLRRNEFVTVTILNAQNEWIDVLRIYVICFCTLCVFDWLLFVWLWKLSTYFHFRWGESLPTSVSSCLHLHFRWIQSPSDREGELPRCGLSWLFWRTAGRIWHEMPVAFTSQYSPLLLLCS